MKGDDERVDQATKLLKSCLDFTYNKHWDADGMPKDFMPDPSFESKVRTQRRLIFAMMSQCCNVLGKYEAAISFGEIAIDLNKSYYELYRPVAEAYWEIGEKRKAISLLKLAIKLEMPPEEVDQLLYFDALKKAVEVWEEEDKLDEAVDYDSEDGGEGGGD